MAIKKVKQAAARKKHREQLKRKRRTRSHLDRSQPALIQKPTILIVCEGRNTEPSYFRQFKLSSAIIKTVGEGYNTISLVKRAIELAEEVDYDQV